MCQWRPPHTFFLMSRFHSLLIGHPFVQIFLQRPLNYRLEFLHETPLIKLFSIVLMEAFTDTSLVCGDMAFVLCDQCRCIADKAIIMFALPCRNIRFHDPLGCRSIGKVHCVANTAIYSVHFKIICGLWAFLVVYELCKGVFAVSNQQRSAGKSANPFENYQHENVS